MSELSSLTIINDHNLRGVFAPANKLSNERLTDLIDFIELSSPEVVKETEELIGDADAGNSWVPLKEVARLSEDSK